MDNYFPFKPDTISIPLASVCQKANTEHFFCSVCVCGVAVVGLRTGAAFHIPGKRSITELHPSPAKIFGRRLNQENYTHVRPLSPKAGRVQALARCGERRTHINRKQDLGGKNKEEGARLGESWD